MITLERYTDGDKQRVESFLLQACNATLFNFPRFYLYHTEDKMPFNIFEPCHLIFLQGNQIISFLAGYLQKQEDALIYKTPCMASYGGLVLAKDLRYKDIEAIFEAMLTYLTAQKATQIDFTPLPDVMYIDDAKKNNYITYLLLKHKFLPIQSDIVLYHKIDISLPLEKQINPKTHTELKQAFKNELTFEISAGVDTESYALLLQSQERLESKPTHTFEDLVRLHALFPDTVYQIKVRKEAELVSGIIAFRYNKNVINTFYIFDNQEGRKLKANHFAYYHLIHWAVKASYKFVDFGPSTFGYTAHNSLIDFKEKWACLPSLRIKYQLKINHPSKYE
jgi:hypothetical protein